MDSWYVECFFMSHALLLLSMFLLLLLKEGEEVKGIMIEEIWDSKGMLHFENVQKVETEILLR